LFAHGGLETLDAIRRIDFDVLRSRPTVSKWRQSALVARAMLGLL
jgi:aryl carrier-like protein